MQKFLKLKGFEVLESQNKVAWLNTVRVFAAFTVILSHYLLLEQIEISHEKIYWALAGIGHIGVILFFAVSGYLASNSLSRSKSILEFYRRKLIRIIVPFVVAYVVLGVVFILLGIVEPPLAQRSPFYNVIYVGGNYFGILFSIFPVEVNLIKYFNLPSCFVGELFSSYFVGEWFIGTIIYMYLIAPLLDKILRYNFFLAMILSLIISWVAFDYLFKFELAGKIFSAWLTFIVRVPEFLMGMIMFNCRDSILKNRTKINLCVCSLIFLFFVFLFPLTNIQDPIYLRICAHHPLDFTFSLPMIYLFFTFAEWLNLKFSVPLEKFNSFSDISYMSMLIQHIVIFLFVATYDLSRTSKFGVWFMFVLVVLTIIFVSRKLHDIYKPIEEWMIKNFLVRK